MISGACKKVLCLAAIMAAGVIPAAAAPLGYGFENEFVQQAEQGFICEYEQYSNSIHTASAWDGGAAVKLSGGTVVPAGDADGMVSYTWEIDAPEAGIYRIILNATRPAVNNYYSGWTLFVNGAETAVITGTTEENNETFANWATAQLNKGKNRVTISIAPRKSGGYFWFILDKMRFAKYSPQGAAAAELTNIFYFDSCVTAELTNTFEYDFFADVYLSDSDEDSLKSVDKQTVFIKKGETCAIKFENIQAADSDDIKVYIWNSGTQYPCSAASKIKAVNAQTSALNVFEQGGAISLSAEADTEYTVYDYFGASVCSGRTDVSNGRIIIGEPLDTGWYCVKSGEEQLSAFAIVPKRGEEVNSPFATDFAAAWLVKNGSGVDYDKIGSYSRAIKLAGIDWVRERSSPQVLNPARGEYDFSGLHRTTEIMSDAGLEVSAVFHSAPDWAKSRNASLYSNLSDVYAFMKNAAAETGGEVDCWEMWNEQDEQLYSAETADRYAAFFKAAAIGAADGGAPIKALGGIAQSPLVRNYTSLMLQNDVMQYADVYNYHAYTHDSGAETAALSQDSLKAHYAQKTAYDSFGTQIWITETGVHCAVDEGGKDLAPAQQKLQARCSVSSAVTTLASGADRAFWFVMPSYNENGKNFGAFSSKDTPNPAYAAMAVMTKALGRAKYIGELKLTSGVYAYVFDTGGCDTAVIWADNETVIETGLADGYIIDIMGRRHELINGAASVSPDPIYLVSDALRGFDSFYPQEYYKEGGIKTDFTDAQKIVLSALPEDLNYTEAKFRGYRVDANGSIPIEIYNFSDKSMSGILYADAEFEGSISFSEDEISLPPMGRTVVYARLKAENVIGEEQYRLRVYGSFNGWETSSLVMRLIFPYPSDKEQDIRLYRAASGDTSIPSLWNVNNISGGTASVDMQDAAVSFDVNMMGNSGWFYPVFKTPPLYNYYVGRSKGFTFTVTADKDYDDVYINAMLYYDGAASLFYLGSRPYRLIKGTNTYYVPWTEFVYNTGTSGAEKTVTPSKVTSVSVGFNSYKVGSVRYKISNVGYYYENNSKAEYSVSINGISDGETADRANMSVSATDNIDEVKIFINGRLSDISDVNTLNKGKYIITAAGYTPWGEAVTDTKVIYVN